MLVLSNEYQNSEGHNFLFSLLYISDALWIDNIKVSVTCYQQLTDRLPIGWGQSRPAVDFFFWPKPDSQPSVSRQMANGQLKVGPQTDGQQKANKLFWEIFTITETCSCLHLVSALFGHHNIDMQQEQLNNERMKVRTQP